MCQKGHRTSKVERVVESTQPRVSRAGQSSAFLHFMSIHPLLLLPYSPFRTFTKSGAIVGVSQPTPYSECFVVTHRPHDRTVLLFTHPLSLISHRLAFNSHPQYIYISLHARRRALIHPLMSLPPKGSKPELQNHADENPLVVPSSTVVVVPVFWPTAQWNYVGPDHRSRCWRFQVPRRPASSL
jgi:hypothetical protein